MAITLEQNGLGETVQVTTLDNGSVSRELLRPPVVSVAPLQGPRNYRAMISRRADALEKSDPLAALKLRLTN